MKKYYILRRVSNIGDGFSNMITTCVGYYDSKEELMKVINELRERFSNTYFMQTGSLARKVAFVKKIDFGGYNAIKVTDGVVFWFAVEKIEEEGKWPYSISVRLDRTY